MPFKQLAFRINLTIFAICLTLAAVSQIPLHNDEDKNVPGNYQVCGSDPYLKNLENNTLYKAAQDKMNRDIINAYRNIIGDTIILPVVVHIVDDFPFSIPDQTILNGIADLNDAFSKSGNYSASLGADTKIRFCLAHKDPDGGITTGITRTESFFSNDMVMDIEDERLKNLIQWDPDRYINIWLIKNIRGEIYASYSCGVWTRYGVGGYATLPPGGGNVDGIVVTGFGALLAHEMGHYLGLYHTFNGGCSNFNCLTDGDLVCDTPPDASMTASACNNPQNSCSSDTLSNYSNGSFPADVPDQISNFMDYNNSLCANRFTPGQTNRMRAAILTQRAGLLQDECEPPCTDLITAGFTTNNPYPLPGDSISFSNTSAGATNYEWLVDNIVADTSTNFSYTFTSTGKYKVTLKAYGSPGCFSASTIYVIVTCGVTARFYPSKQKLASNTIYPDSVIFTNTSVNATNFEWQISVGNTASFVTMSTGNSFTYTFPAAETYWIRLIAWTGACADTTNALAVSVIDPMPDGVPFGGLTVLCYQPNKVKVNFCLVNRGYKALPAGTPVSFYDSDPRVAGAHLIPPVMYLPFATPGGNCYMCYNHILNIDYHGLERIYMAFNDSGNTVPVVLPNTNLPESNYINNFTAWASVRTTISTSVCQGQSYAGYTTAGTYIDTLSSVNNGCDSIRTLHLTIRPVFFTTVNAVICRGENYAGHTLSGTYTDVYAAVNGCDSTRTLHLTVNPNSTKTIDTAICQGQNYAGHTLSGTYVDHFISANGCDSARTLRLVVHPTFNVVVKDTICAGQFAAGYNATGTYTDHFTTTHGCDSTRTLQLFVKPKSFKNITKSICRGQAFEGYTTTGTHIDTFVSASGCDSIRTINLTILQPVFTSVNASICNGQQYEGYTITGTYADIFTGANGCDSTRTLHLTVKPNRLETVSATICQGQTHAGYAASGTYTDHFIAANGCDSTRVLLLTVKPVSRVTIRDTICEGQQKEGYAVSGTFTDHFTAANGCDSTRILILKVIQTVRTTISRSICRGQSFLGHTVSGTYTDTLVASGGCDSVLTTILTVNQPVFTIISAAICRGDIYAGYTATGTYTDRFTGANGCDSTRTLHLTVKPVFVTVDTKEICQNQTYAGYNQTGTYVDHFTAVNGCDSMRTLHLTVHPVKTTRVPVHICKGETYFAGNQQQTLSGNYYDTLHTTFGCDSVIITQLNVTPLPNPDLGINRGLCRNETISLSPGSFNSYLWQDGSTAPGLTVNQLGQFWVTVQDTFHCAAADTITIDPWFELPVNFLSQDDSICKGNVISIGASGYADYLWSTGFVSGYINVTTSGSYMLAVTDSKGCKGTDSIRLVFYDCLPIQIPTAFSPNNDGLNDYFKPLISSPVTNYHFEIRNRWGLLLFETQHYKVGWDGYYKSELQSIGAYVYFITLTDYMGNHIKRKGSFILVR